MALAAQYDSQKVEEKWYDYWMKNNYFHSEVDERKPYTIVIPPPNVTGVLHMGHMLNNTIQDVLIRRARLRGFNACWVPGTDHASIATEAKVVAKLKDQGIEKNDLTREEFLEHAWEWTREYGGVILDQLKKLGASCDWERTKFTLDQEMSTQVIKTFVDLYNKGLIYRGYRMVNWDPEAQTTLSDEEVIHVEKQGKLYHIKYQIEGSEDFLIVATTRPETIFGDTAICINPNDERFTHLKGKKAIVPVVNRVIPIIEDAYVDVEFGTGCLKVTPAHDENDKVLGEKHHLEVIDIFNNDASLNDFGLHYKGQDRFAVRKAFTAELEEKGFLVKTENHTNKVGTSERTKAIIEPKLSDQWFLKMEALVKPAITAVLDTEGPVTLHPKKFENTYRHWMENIRDWNISRQLWWGHQIPAFYYGPGKEDFVVAASAEEALNLAQEKLGNASLTITDLQQDEDALDTWFSSWLWPMSVFNGVSDPENKEFKYYYPTNDLVTGPDILFFWVARMIIAGYEYTGKEPFQNVYLTGLVRDKQRRKMSKSLGNSPDALKLIENYGADGVRVGLLLSAAAGNDLMFDEDLCQQGKAFVNKIWNAFRLIKGWEVKTGEQPIASKKAIAWYAAKFQSVLKTVDANFEKYRLSDALMSIYKLIYDDFCGNFLEIIKPAYGAPIDQKTFDEAIRLLEDNLRILHPFIPFASEEIWQNITQRTTSEALIVNTYPKASNIDTQIIEAFDVASEVISGIRTIRKDKNIAFKDAIALQVINNENTSDGFDIVIQKLCNISTISYSDEHPEGAQSFRVKSNEYFVPLHGAINIEEELAKLNEELSYTEGFLISVQKKLSNERFVAGAPEQVVANERKKEADAIAKIETLKTSISGLS